MVEALIAGERDPAVLADLAKGRMRVKTAELVEALASNWAEHHSVSPPRSSPAWITLTPRSPNCPLPSERVWTGSRR
jgi:hypothetical protein